MKKTVIFSILALAIIFFNFKPEAKADLVKGFLKQGRYNSAVITMRNSIDFELNDRKEHLRMAHLCWEKGFEVLQKNMVDSGIFLINAACEVDASLYKKTRDRALIVGKTMFQEGQYARGSHFLDLSYTYNLTISNGPPNYSKHYDLKIEKTIATMLFEASNMVKDDPVAKKELLAKACKYDPVYIVELNYQIVSEYQDKPRQERERVVDQFSAYLSADVKKKLLPEPVWVEIPETYGKYIGKGWGENNAIPVAKNINIKKGWRINATATEFKVYRSKGWQNCNNSFSAIQSHDTNGLPFGYMAPKGEEIKFWAEQLVHP